MLGDFKIEQGRPTYIQLKEYLKRQILNGLWQAGERLPSTRELAAVLQIGRLQ